MDRGEKAVLKILMDHLREAAESPSRLTVSPLPEEIAGLIKRLRGPLFVTTESDHEANARLTREAASALEWMAREIANREQHENRIAELKLLEREQQDRIRALEAEIERHKAGRVADLRAAGVKIGQQKP
jgi:hypothetical protein